MRPGPGRGDVAAHEGEQCIAENHSGRRCRLVGRIPTEWGRVCSSHNMHGFLPFAMPASASVSPAIALRMRAVLEAA